MVASLLLSLLPLFCLPLASALQLRAPANASQTIMVTPQLSWYPWCEQRASEPACGDYHIEITRVAGDGARLVFVEDVVPSILTRFIPSNPLPPGHWWWRVGNDGTWSEERLLSIAAPEHTLRVPASANYTTIQNIFATAAAAAGAGAGAAANGDDRSIQVVFEPGLKLRLEPPAAEDDDDQDDQDDQQSSYRSSDIFLRLENCSNIVVDFAGAHITFTKWIGFVHVEACENVVIRNVTFDMDPVPYTALQVDEVLSSSSSFSSSSTRSTRSTRSRSFRGTVVEGHPLPDDLHITTRTAGSVLDGATTRTKRGVVEVLKFLTNWTSVAQLAENDSRTYEVQLESQDPLAEGMAPGDIFLMGERVGPAGFEVVGSRDVTFLDVLANACANECFTSAYTDRLAILGGGLVLLPGRFKAANDGGHNHHSSREAAWVERGTWESTGDDICHVSGLVFSASAIVDEGFTPTVTLTPYSGDTYSRSRGGALGVQVGDVLQLFDKKRGSILAEIPVVSLSRTIPGGFGVNATLGSALPSGLVTGTITGSDAAAATQFFNLNRSASSFTFRRNTVRNGRRFGVLMKGQHLLVEDNLFVGQGSGAVLALNSPFEGLCARSAVVRRNRAIDVHQLSTNGANQPGAFFTWVLPSGGGKACHRDLLFANNTVDSGPHPLASLSGTSDVVFADNQFSRCADDGYSALEVWDDVDANSVRYKATNVELNSTLPRLCSKRPRLVKSGATGSAVYFLDYLYGTAPRIASKTLHHLGSCLNPCVGENLCQSGGGVLQVSDEFVESRTVGDAFSCTMWPGPRFLSCSNCSGALDGSVFFQNRFADTATSDTAIYKVESCDMCPGDVCANVVAMPDTYFQHLVVADGAFDCAMAQGALA